METNQPMNQNQQDKGKISPEVFQNDQVKKESGQKWSSSDKTQNDSKEKSAEEFPEIKPEPTRNSDVQMNQLDESSSQYKAPEDRT